MRVWTRPPLLIAISRSGETTETVWALQRLREQGATTVALTCSEGGALSRASDLPITLPVEEHSVVMTGSFTSMLLVLAALAATLSGDVGAVEGLHQAPDLAAPDLSALVDRARAFAGAASRPYVYLGSGPLYGIACEGALKMTEMALVPGYAYHTLEYLHGPKAAVSPQTVVIGLLSSRGSPYEAQALKHLADLGAVVIAVGAPVESLPAVRFTAEMGTVPAMMLAGLWMQLLALYVARARGVDPDAPRDLEPQVTQQPSWEVYSSFPRELAELKKYDVIVIEEVEADIFYFYPEFYTPDAWTSPQTIVLPNRPELIRQFVKGGGGLLMVGGWLSFQGRFGHGVWHGTPVEEALPGGFPPTDDRVENPRGAAGQ